MNDIKHFGRVYTPPEIVRQMLTPLFASRIEGLRICDPACGTGDFLAPIVEEICKRGGDMTTLKQITGYDVNGEAVQICRARLSDTAERILGRSIPSTFWRIFHTDAMDAWQEDSGSFDWIVGNPPYVRIQHLEAERREKIRKAGWQYFCGSSDLYIVFFELGLRLLKDKGNLIYISPSGWLRNDAGQKMRLDLEANHRIISLYDYRDYQVFPGLSTYTCITHISKGKAAGLEKIYRWNGRKFANSYKLMRSDSKWAVVSASFRLSRAASVKLSDIADIHVGVQTLADRIFILAVNSWQDDFAVCELGGKELVLEKGAVRPILKASVLREGKDRLERVAIFPYDDHGKLMSENVFRNDFPYAYNWLRQNKKLLLSRDKGKIDKRKWYGYGREVGIKTSFGYKILTSSMNPSPNFQICENPAAMFYSGYCIKPRIDIELASLVKKLNSPAMEHHVREFSQPFRNGWFSYAKRYIQDFALPVEQAMAWK